MKVQFTYQFRSTVEPTTYHIKELLYNSSERKQNKRRHKKERTVQGVGCHGVVGLSG